MDIHRTLFIVGMLLFLPIFSFSQNGWGLTTGNETREGNSGIYFSYRLPGSITVDPLTGLSVGPQVFPIVLGYSRSVGNAHLFGAEGGWIRSPFLFLVGNNGNVIDVNSNTPQLRANYKFLPLGGNHLIEPYVGGGIVVGASFANPPGQRFLAINGDFQAMIGARVYPKGPFFLQVEVPYTFAILRQLLTQNVNNTTGNTEFSLGPDFNSGQFWPLIGIGIEW